MDWDKQLVLEHIEYKMYVLNSGHHDEKKFKGTVIFSERTDKIGDVRAFNKKDFKSVNQPITLIF